MRRRNIAPGLLAAGLVLVLSAPASAASSSPEPVLTHADIAVTMHDGADDRVRATYRLAEPAEEPTPVPLLALPRTGADITELSAGPGVTEIGPVRGLRAVATLPAGVREYTVEYRVRRTGGQQGVPLVIPDIATARAAEVTISVTLPPGRHLVGDAMPTFTSESTPGERTVLRHTGRSLPSVVVAEYGTTSRASLGDVSSYTGLVLMAGVVLVWLYHSMRKERIRA
ncbi:hypothetical protein ACFS2C_10445 [Prauserella oleivorans]|uniref:Uncharacterized protein n=1 Tax=Prauserella oleivorans TaxID=1478153 RepID=A0ABW5WBV3_9PSEU